MDLYCHKAQYRPGEAVELIWEGPETAELSVTVTRLETPVTTVQLSRQENGRFCLGAFPEGGYGVCAQGGGVRQYTAFDVAGEAVAYPRYGFLSDFAPDQAGEDRDVELLSKLHINFVQYYDWMYRHHEFLPPEETFVDPLGRTLSLDVIRGKLAACHEKGMKCMAYGAIYGAEEEYTSLHPEQVMLKKDGTWFNIINFIHMMDFAPERPWSDHIIGEFRQARQLGFDGIHMDQYGYPKFAYTGRVDPSTLFDVENAFAPFIEKTRRELDRTDDAEDKSLLFFNAVNNWPVRKVAPAPVDAVYIEVWSPYDSYAHLERLIVDAKRYGGNKAVILAAYLKPFSPREPAPAERAEACFRLASAAIYASGGFHLALGEEQGVLQDAYYPDYGRYSDAFLPVVRRYADYVVRYRDLLNDDEAERCSMDYCGGVNGDLYIPGVPVSSDARPGTVWASVRKKPGTMVIHLINLLDQEDALWNVGKTPPAPREALPLTVYCKDIACVYGMSPDGEDISMRPLPFEEVPHFGGKGYQITLDRLEVWSTIVIREMETDTDRSPLPAQAAVGKEQE